MRVSVGMKIFAVLAMVAACAGPDRSMVASHAPKDAPSMPAFHASAWINSPPLAPEALRGKVVLVDFWEYTCVNCIRTLPFVKAWWRQYRDAGLVVVGVHAPEFAFGKLETNVDRGAKQFGLTYPIALDDDMQTWDAYDNHSWPAHYLFDAGGKLRAKWVGEGNYQEMEASIRQLLHEADPRRRLPAVTDETRTWSEDYAQRRGISDETYLGTARRVKGAFTLEGDWKETGEYVEHEGSEPGRLTMRFTAGEVNLVMQPGASGIGHVKIYLDDHVLTEHLGADVGKDAYARFDRSGMIRLIAGAPKESHQLVLETHDPGLRMFSFTFGP